jgi:hypothetical protein
MSVVSKLKKDVAEEEPSKGEARFRLETAGESVFNATPSSLQMNDRRGSFLLLRWKRRSLRLSK